MHRGYVLRVPMVRRCYRAKRGSDDLSSAALSLRIGDRSAGPVERGSDRVMTIRISPASALAIGGVLAASIGSIDVSAAPWASRVMLAANMLALFLDWRAPRSKGST